MKDFFKELFEYNHHFNQKIADQFVSNSDKTTEKSVKLYSHILNSHNIWNGRIKPPQSNFTVWQMHEIKDFHLIDKTNYQNSLSILDSFDLNQVVQFTLANGKIFNNSIRDILFQTINHSTYHRAQIATEFKNIGIEPLLTEYIAYKW